MERSEAFTARRAAAADSKHSKAVLRAKRGLLGLAACLVIAVLVLTQQGGDKAYIRLDDGLAQAATDNDVLRVVNPRFQGIDDNNQPYNISAESARQQRADSPNIELQGIKADVKQGEDTVTISSRAATVDRQTRAVALDGHVDVTHEGGYALSTDNVTVDTKAGTASSDRRVRGVTPAGTVDAAGIDVTNFGERLLFKGRSAVTIAPEAATTTTPPLRQDVPLR